MRKGGRGKHSQSVREPCSAVGLTSGPFWLQSMPETEAGEQARQEQGVAQCECGAIRGRPVAHLVRPRPVGGRPRARAHPLRRPAPPPGAILLSPSPLIAESDIECVKAPHCFRVGLAVPAAGAISAWDGKYNGEIFFVFLSGPTCLPCGACSGCSSWSVILSCKFHNPPPPFLYPPPSPQTLKCLFVIWLDLCSL